MSNSAHTQTDLLSSIAGKRIKSASSSLQNFSVEFDDASGLIVEAGGDKEEPKIKMELVGADKLPSLKEAVCSVDWSWIYGSTVKRALGSASNVKFELEPVGPLIVGISVWQGSPFLSFQPFRPPVR